MTYCPCFACEQLDKKPPSTRQKTHKVKPQKTNQQLTKHKSLKKQKPAT